MYIVCKICSTDGKQANGTVCSSPVREVEIGGEETVYGKQQLGEEALTYLCGLYIYGCVACAGPEMGLDASCVREADELGR